MYKLLKWWIFGVALAAASQLVRAEVAPAARGLAERIDSLDVEHRWRAGAHVRWETGIPDGRPERSFGKHTHCSAFVAAAAKQAGIYILRPPEHPQTLLANAQFDWLAADGRAQGWAPLASGVDAQRYANQGWFVVATYKNIHDDKPGHIAVVRPSDKSVSAILEEGPQITQAGTVNYRDVPLRVGFAGHPLAWSRQAIRYYAHPVTIGE
jgi:hypothetical protein